VVSRWRGHGSRLLSRRFTGVLPHVRRPTENASGNHRVDRTLRILHMHWLGIVGVPPIKRQGLRRGAYHGRPGASIASLASGFQHRGRGQRPSGRLTFMWLAIVFVHILKVHYISVLTVTWASVHAPTSFPTRVAPRESIFSALRSAQRRQRSCQGSATCRPKRHSSRGTCGLGATLPMYALCVALSIATRKMSVDRGWLA